MERSRNARRGSMVAATRRHRNHSVRDSPEMDAAVELPETSRLRDRDRDRSGNRERDRMINCRNNKRRRAERLSSEESVNDEEDEDEYYDGGGGSIPMLPPTTSSSSALNHHRKSFPPLSPVMNNKHFRPVTAAGGVSVPRKARSASAKRSHEWPSSCGVVGDQFHRQASTSPLRPAVKSPSPAPASSPSSSHVSIKKKPRLNGPKLKRPSKMAKSLPSAQDEIEIEVAEVLYEMMRQPQGPTTKVETITATSDDAKSRASSSPISSSACAPPPHSASAFPQNSSSSTTSMSASAPKRKRPRAKHEEEPPPMKIEVSTTSKAGMDHLYIKVEDSSSNLEKKSAKNGVFSYNLSNSRSFPDPESHTESIKDSAKPENKRLPDSNDESTSQKLKSRKEEAQSAKKEFAVLRSDDKKVNSTKSESHREEKFQIDLMAPPPYRSSPEREGDVDFMSVDPKPTAIVAPQTEVLKALLTKEVDEEKAEEVVKKDAAYSEEDEFKRPVVGSKERSIGLHLDLERSDRDSGNVGFSGRSNLPQHGGGAKQQQSTDKTTLKPSSVPLPISMTLGWPGGLSPMGYMAPLQGIVPMDGSTLPPAAMQPPQVLFNQPRPKRCATHCYIARNIYYHQQMSKMNPFWPMAAGSGSMYGTKHNPSVVPPEFHGTVPGRGANYASDKGQGITMFPAQPGKEKPSLAVNLMDAQRKQLVMEQALPPGAPSNILHGPAFIFPMSQQQAAAAAASVRPGTVKSPGAGSAALPSIVNTPSITASVTPAVAPAMSFNYLGNEPQYLAIMPNNAYPFSMPAHVGAPPTYRGPHAQTLPYFSGSYYSGQMVHPSQLQQQQQQPPSQSQQNQQGHQNPSISSGSSSSQKHLQNQQLRPPSSGMNGVNGLQGFPASKSQPSQTLQQQRQNQQNTHAPHQARQIEHEKGGEDSPSTADSRISHPNIGIYPQNFTMAMPPPNFSLMTPTVGSSNGATAVSGSEKKQQQQGSKTGVEGSPAYAVSFALNGANPATGFDMASLVHSQAIFQSLPEATKQGYQQIMAAAFQAQAAQHKKNYRHPEEMKGVIGDSSNEEERKAMTGKSSSVGHSIAFSTDGSTSTIPGNNVLDSSAARSLNLSSAPGKASSSVIPVSAGAVNAPTPQQQFEQHLRNHQQQQQLHQMQQHQIQQQQQHQIQQQQQHQIQQQQQHQMLQLQKQQLQKQQLQKNAVRSKTPATSNGSTYSEHLPSTSSMAAKFPNALSSFPQNLVQATTSPFQSPQLKNSSRTPTSQAPATSLASSTSSSLKNHPQKQGRTQQSHTQISFAANPKSTPQNQGIQSNNNQSPSPPIMVGSPTTTTSSMSKSAGGSPRTNTSNSTGNKAGQASSLSSQQVKNSTSVPSQKTFMVAGRNAPSSTGITSHSTQVHQQQQQQVSKQSIQQPQLYFSSAYMGNQQASHPNSTGGSTSPSGGYYVPARRRGDMQQLQPQHSQGSSGTSAAGMLSLSPPVTLANNTSTTDPAKAVAAAATHMKGGSHHAQFATAQSAVPHQLVPSSFPSVHAVPTVVQMKSAEQKK